METLILNRLFKVVLISALSAGIGGMLAVQIDGYSWWLGAILGGFAGYLLYDYKTFLKAIPEAGRRARFWQPDKQWWRALGLLYLYKLIVAIPWTNFFCVLFMGFIWLVNLTRSIERQEPVDDIYFLPFALWVCLFCTAIISLISLVSILAVEFKDWGNIVFAEDKEDYLKIIKSKAFNENFFTVFFWRIPCGVYNFFVFVFHSTSRIIKNSSRFHTTIGRFFKHLFLLTYSEPRLLCAISAFFGVIVGYSYGKSVLLCMLAGGLWGVINYYLISVRLLHLNQTSSAR